jgi:O-antigen/teichoic acid export membrane protein
MFSGNINQLMLGTLSSVTNVALYSVPVRAASTGSVMINKMMQVFYPGFSGMDKEREIDRIREIYFSVISIQLFVMSPLLIAVMLEGQTLLAVWIDPEFAAASGSIIILVALTYFSSALTNLPTFTAMSLNHPQLISKYSIIRLVIVAIIVYPAIRHYGIVGAAWVLLLSELPAIGFLFESTWMVFRENFYRVLAGPLIKHTLIGSCLYFLYDFAYRDSSWYHPSAAVLVIALHVILALKFTAINSTDNRRLKRLITVWR